MEIQKLAVLVAATAASLVAQSNWRGIQPGTSTRAQSERVTGAAVQAITDTLVEYKGAKPGERVFVQYRTGGVVERVEIVLDAPMDRAEARRTLALGSPDASKQNSRGKTEEYFGAAMMVLTIGGGGVERYAYYSRELFEAAVGRLEPRQPERPPQPPLPPPIVEPKTPVVNRPVPPNVLRQFATIPAATKFEVRLSEKLSTAANKAGDRFRATLNHDIQVDSYVVVQKGAEVEGRITNLTQSGRVKGLGEMHLELVSLRAVTGETLPISTSAIVQTSESTAGGDAKKVGAGAAIGAVVGAVVGGAKGAAIGAGAVGAGMGGVLIAGRGKPAELPVEALLSFQLTAAVHLPAPGEGKQ